MQQKTCTVSGITTDESNFYRRQNHCKAVDNARRLTGATTKQLTNLFNTIHTY